MGQNKRVPAQLSALKLFDKCNRSLRHYLEAKMGVLKTLILFLQEGAREVVQRSRAHAP